MVFAERTEAQLSEKDIPAARVTARAASGSAWPNGLRLLSIRFSHDGFALIVLLCFSSIVASDALTTGRRAFRIKHIRSTYYNSGRPIRAFIGTLLESSGAVKQQSITLGGGSIWLA